MTFRMLPTRVAVLLMVAANLGVVVLVGGCSAAPPQLVRVEARLEHVHDLDRGVWYEQVVLFALVRDEDGFADIEQLFLLNDEHQLYWRLDGEGWTHERRAGEDWIGLAGLVMADDEDFPRGLYRVVVLDAAGQQDEQRVLIDSPRRVNIAGQLPVVGNAVAVVPAGGAVLRVVSTTRDDEPPTDRTLAAGEHRIDDLIPADSVGFLFVPLDDYSGIVSGPLRR